MKTVFLMIAALMVTTAWSSDYYSCVSPTTKITYEYYPEFKSICGYKNIDDEAFFCVDDLIESNFEGLFGIYDDDGIRYMDINEIDGVITANYTGGYTNDNDLQCELKKLIDYPTE